MVEDLRQLGNNWDSFLLEASIPKDPKGHFPLPAKMGTSHRVEVEAGRAMEEGRSFKALSPQKLIPWRGGRPRKKKKSRETQISSDLCIKSVAEESLMHIIRLELVECTSQERWGRRRRIDTKSAYFREPS
jgi:hypothetical protein